MLLIKKGKVTKRFCDRCHKRSRNEVCSACMDFNNPGEAEWREVERHADRIYEDWKRSQGTISKHA